MRHFGGYQGGDDGTSGRADEAAGFVAVPLEGAQCAGEGAAFGEGFDTLGGEGVTFGGEKTTNPCSGLP